MGMSKVTRIVTKGVFLGSSSRGMFKGVVYVQEGFIKVSMSGDLVQRGRNYFQCCIYKGVLPEVFPRS